MNMNRRQLLTGSVAAAATLLGSRIAAPLDATACLGAPTRDQPVMPNKLVSLRKMLKEQHPHLGGMTRIDGHALAMSNEQLDVILWGRVEPKEPELRFDDLIVAIKSVRGDYYRQTAAVSLDPSPNAQLREDANKALENGEQDNFRRFDTLCKELMNHIRIDGMPQQCQAAKTLLDADYRMKLVAHGAAKLPIKNFKSTFDIKTEMITASLAATNTFPNGITRNRYWFTAGETSYLPDKGSSFIDCVQIVLKNEREDAVVDQNKTADRTFSCAWTDRMQEILQSELIWKQMNGIYRHFALAKVLHESDDLKNLTKESIHSMDFKVPSVDIPAQYPVLANHKEIIAKASGKKWSWTDTYCGGVSLAGKLVKSPLMKSDSARSDLSLITAKVVVSARNSGLDSHWDI